MKPELRAVPTDLPEPPYPADTKVRGWRFELDHERINQSDTWALAPAEMRPWLLMLWHVAWQQIPAGSLPKEDTIIAAKIGMDRRIFDAHRDILMRGWQLHSDNRLYHRVIGDQVKGHIAYKENERKRKAAYREKMSHGTDKGQTWESGHQNQNQNQNQNKDITQHSSAESKTAKAVPPSAAVPYVEICKLWAEILPDLPQPVKLTDARRAKIRARYLDELPDLDSWRECFEYVKESAFLMGRIEPRNGRAPFRCTLDWITKQDNLIKLYEGKYDGKA